ncbi:hypothetical protein AABB24_024320, partial [Solanum stoloniferum]
KYFTTSFYFSMFYLHLITIIYITTMVGVMARKPLNHRILTWDHREFEISGEPAINNSDTVFSFLDEEVQSSSPESINDDVYVNNRDDEDDDNENKENVEDNQFWENQRQLLQSVLCRTTSLESQIRSITKETKQSENGCSCRKMVGDGCRNCLMKEVCTLVYKMLDLTQQFVSLSGRAHQIFPQVNTHS